MNLEKPKEKIQLMFDEIASTYDRLNHLFTLNRDIIWRKDIIKYLKKNNFKPNYILDLASGTGSLTKELLDLDPKKIFAVDISSKMLEIQRRRINDKRLTSLQADASNLPFENNYFELVTIGFGIRNFENLEGSLMEIQRVLKPNYKLIILEMFKSDRAVARIFNLYFGNIMPLIGNKISRSKYAYNYLFNSVKNFYNTNDFEKICKSTGFSLDYSKNNFLGIVNTLYFSKNFEIINSN